MARVALVDRGLGDSVSVDGAMTWHGTLTTAAEEVLEHVEWIGLVALTSFVCLESLLHSHMSSKPLALRDDKTHLAVTFIDLPFLWNCQHQSRRKAGAM